ncbi:hypothetical protein B1A_15296, partial [mine drainage metagenome]
SLHMHWWEPFLGILLAYGFVGPLGGLLEQKAEESTKMFKPSR